MTRLDSPLKHSKSHTEMESRSRNTSRRASVSQRTESRPERDHSSNRAIFQRASRFLSHDREPQDGRPSTPVRYYERGHPLPSNCSPERKATIPFRNPELGLPSYRRRQDTLNDETVSGLSPQRHMSYSNFRRGESQSRASPHSGSPRSTNVSPHRQREFRSSSHRRGSVSQRHTPSHTSSQRTSGKCSPAVRRDSRMQSPSQISTSNKYSSRHSHSQKQSPYQSSYGHSLDSEKLYRNLQSIASSEESDRSYQGRSDWSKRSRAHMEMDGQYYENGRSRRNSGYSSRKNGHSGCNSRDFSPPCSQISHKGSSHPSGCNSRHSGHDTSYNTGSNSPASAPYRENDKKSHRKQKTDKGEAKSDRQSRREFQSHFQINPTSPESSHDISPSKKQPLPITDTQNAERSKSTIRRGLEALILSENTRSTSQPPVPEMTLEDYVIIADIPKVNLYPDEEEPIVVRRRPQSRSPRRDNRHSEGRESSGEYRELEERGRGRERGRDRREREKRHHDKDTGGSSETNSTVSGPTQASQRSREENKASKRDEGGQRDQTLMQLNVLDVKKGWMFMLDDTAEWRKFWFVLDHSGLRYYTNPEEGDEPEGEIDIQCCLSIVEFEVDNYYGLQIHMQDAEITLSAMTSRIRKNWLDTLQNRIRRSVKQNPDSSSSSSNSTSQNASPRLSQPHQPDSGSEGIGLCQDESGTTSLPSTHQREAGVGRDQEQEKRFGDRTKWFQEALSDREGGSPWDKVELKKGAAAPAGQGLQEIPETSSGMEIERKWEDFEKLLVGEMRPLSPIGYQEPRATSEELQTEVLSLRQQVEKPRKGRVRPGSAVPCGPDSPCASRLHQIESEYRKRLEEMEREHVREKKEMERERERLLQEEAQHAVKAIEALRKAHEDEMERVRATESAITVPESASLQQELDGLSERYTQRCVELNQLQNSTGQRHTLMEEREKEVERLRKDNQELQARVTEEITLMRAFITGQRSGVVPLGSCERSTSELEMLLRVKQNEIECLQKEISCLRNEVQSLTKENQELSERYTAVYVELCGVKGLGEIELGSLKEHLRLTSVALQEEQQVQRQVKP